MASSSGLQSLTTMLDEIQKSQIKNFDITLLVSTAVSAAAEPIIDRISKWEDGLTSLKATIEKSASRLDTLHTI